MALQKIEKQNVGDMVFEQLKDSIMAGEWKPGEKMPSENELVSILGVSRISVRSALQRLSGLGLIESRRGEGTFVRKFYSTDGLKAVIPVIAMTAHDRSSLFEFRRIIEVEAAALAAERADDKILHGMEDSLEGMLDPETAAEADFAFHNMVAKATTNPFIISIYEILQDYYIALFKKHAASSTSAQRTLVCFTFVRFSIMYSLIESETKMYASFSLTSISPIFVLSIPRPITEPRKSL